MADKTSGTATAEPAMTGEGAAGMAKSLGMEGQHAQHDGGFTVPMLTVGVRRVHLPAPGAVMAGALNGAAGVSDAVRDRIMPDRQTMLYYGGLGAMAAFGVLSWPAAAAIGAGVWVAERARGAGRPAMKGGPVAARHAAGLGEGMTGQGEGMGGRPAATESGRADGPQATVNSEQATRRRQPLP
jgi:hypothetical protein